MTRQQHGLAVITGAASGLGLETCRIAARRGMRIVMADVQADVLEIAAREIEGLGAEVLPFQMDVSKARQVEDLAAVTLQRFGTPTLLFNNAGVGGGGLVWESTVKDWEWVLGVNLMGVVHGVRVFTPLMLRAEKHDPAYRGHIVNTASMAGLVSMPNMGVYNVSKHAVVALTETLYQDLALVAERVHAHVLCPFFVPTGITRSERNRPPEAVDLKAKATRSQLVGQLMSEKAVSSSKVSAAEVAQFVFDAIDANRFYIYSHPKALRSVQTRLEDIMAPRNPSDPFADRPDVGAQLKNALREG
jgi:NAD(P)-dependent dehydrogenase (short-subunit alcohol dehydrogenase family)